MTDKTIPEQQAEIRRLSAERRRLRDQQGPPAEPAHEPAKRLSLSQIVELLLNRGGGEHSSVELSRNAKGETQIAVTVRTADAGDVLTAEQAMAKAVDLYDQLRSRYPMASGFTSAQPADAKPSKGS
jgi:hypothetical protein